MADIFNMSDTWNNGATVFYAIKMNVTDTASHAASKLIDLQVNSQSKFYVSSTARLGIEIGGYGSNSVLFLALDNAGFTFAQAAGASPWATITNNGIHLGASNALTILPAAVTVATLPAVGSVAVGCRGFVNDASVVAAGNFGTVVAGGGANKVPVFADGTDWRIG